MQSTFTEEQMEELALAIQSAIDFARGYPNSPDSVQLHPIESIQTLSYKSMDH